MAADSSGWAVEIGLSRARPARVERSLCLLIFSSRQALPFSMPEIGGLVPRAGVVMQCNVASSHPRFDVTWETHRKRDVICRPYIVPLTLLRLADCPSSSLPLQPALHQSACFQVPKDSFGWPAKTTEYPDCQGCGCTVSSYQQPSTFPILPVS